MIKIEAIIEEVINGAVTKIRICDEIYLIHLVGYYEDELVEEIQTPEQPEMINKGEVIDHVNKTPIYSNIFEEIISTCGFTFDKDVYIKIISRYYPNNPYETMRKYIYAYKNQIQRETNIKVEPVTEFKYRKNRSRKPDGTIHFDKTYKRWIKEDEYIKVKRALFTFGAVPTTEFVVKETGLKSAVVRSVLNYMKENKQVEKKYKDDGSLYYSYIADT